MNSNSSGQGPPNASSRVDGKERTLLQTLAGLTVRDILNSRFRGLDYVLKTYQGTTINLTTKAGKRYEGVIASTAGERNMLGLTLRDVKELSAPGAPLKEHFFIPTTDIEVWFSGPADVKVPNGDCMRYRFSCFVLFF